MLLEVKNFDKFNMKVIRNLFLMKFNNDIEEFRVDLSAVDTIGITKNYSNEDLGDLKFNGLIISICSKSYTNMIFFKDMISEPHIEKIIHYYKYIEQTWIQSRQDQTFNLDTLKISEV
jgi:hypothetical protein